jgi:hypothetical protein
MSHEIEADYKDYCENEAAQCFNCTSFELHAEQGFCNEAKSEVPATAHCDFFQSRD